MKRRHGLVLLLLVLVPFARLTSPPRVVAGESGFSRGDLARALRHFEAAWDDRRDALPEETRRQVVDSVTKATFGFFSGDFEGSTAQLARATAALRGSDPAAEVLGVSVPAIAAAGVASLSVKLVRPSSLSRRELRPSVSLLGPDGRAVFHQDLRLEAKATEAATSLDLHELGAGASTLVLSLDGKELGRRPLAVVSDLAARLERLDAVLGRVAGRRLATLRARRSRIARALEGRDDGVDRDYGQEVAALESDVAAVASGEDPFPRRSGDELRAVAVAKGELVYRLVVPASASAKRASVVLALHGVGGDEDMFCEAYGRGIVPRLAVEAGAIFVAPRSPMMAGGESLLAVLDDVARDYDVGAVYLVGHSMGAAQALDLVEAHPDRFAAAALFGGPARRSSGRLTVPVFVAVGSSDFARGGAKAFADAARRDGGSVRYDEREGLEHLLIVREAAPEAFAFFKERGLGDRKRFY